MGRDNSVGHRRAAFDKMIHHKVQKLHARRDALVKFVRFVLTRFSFRIRHEIGTVKLAKLVKLAFAVPAQPTRGIETVGECAIESVCQGAKKGVVLDLVQSHRVGIDDLAACEASGQELHDGAWPLWRLAILPPAIAIAPKLLGLAQHNRRSLPATIPNGRPISHVGRYHTVLCPQDDRDWAYPNILRSFARRFAMARPACGPLDCRQAGEPPHV